MGELKQGGLIRARGQPHRLRGDPTVLEPWLIFTFSALFNRHCDNSSLTEADRFLPLRRCQRRDVANRLPCDRRKRRSSVNFSPTPRKRARHQQRPHARPTCPPTHGRTPDTASGAIMALPCIGSADRCPWPRYYRDRLSFPGLRVQACSETLSFTVYCHPAEAALTV
ncbi:hypothetical protein AAFF_G00310070 [Aldrovandia affinis]|uniref:Uncharacterized protein n=1 Tax=Aldrovandia affinis TaxID=143900 RepID=A0AAD7SNV5_9TELE|nr:hypothetical protein AAFF_G00310070 [Aldrovandia affinis]